MNPHACFGDTNPNALLDTKTVREIRLLHLCDGVTASQIARDLQLNVSSVSRIVNWKAWAHQDDDLKVIPKPGHKGGDKYHQRKPASCVSLDPLGPARSCRSCLHLSDNGLCGFGFPECLKSAYKEARKCNVYQPMNGQP